MIIMFIIWLLRKKLGCRKVEFILKKLFVNGLVSNKPLVILLFTVLLSLPVFAQQQAFTYNILYKNNIIGHMQYIQQKSGNNLYLKIVSVAETRILMNIKVNVQEEAHYINDKLVYSHVYRYVNGKTKVNKQTKAFGDAYQTSSDGKSGSVITQQIDWNFTMLYCKEPLNISQVYSDAFQQFIAIKTLQPHVYKVELPDGNYNVYHYKNGICNKVDVHNSWCTVQMQLTQNSIF